MARPGLLGHRKFLRLCRLIGQPIPYALGLLECLWSTGYDCGDPYLGRDAVDVEAAAQWPGEPGALFSALSDAGVGFVEPSPLSDRPGWQIHDLLDHAPDMVVKRARREIFRRCAVNLKESRVDIIAWIRKNPRWVLGITDSSTDAGTDSSTDAGTDSKTGSRRGLRTPHGLTPALALALAPALPLTPTPGSRVACAPLGNSGPQGDLSEQPEQPAEQDTISPVDVGALIDGIFAPKPKPAPVDEDARREQLKRQARELGVSP